jgi:DNA-binding MarR family transcriptional regulator
MRVPRPRPARAGAQPFNRHVPGVRYGILDELTGYAVRRAQIAIYEDLDRVMAPLNITPPRFSSLVLIEQNPGILQSELATIIGVGRPAMVAIIDFLQAQGWLRRQSHDGDRRANHLVLTPKGLTHLARVKAVMAELDDAWTSRLSAAERRTLTALLDKVGSPPPAD